MNPIQRVMGVCILAMTFFRFYGLSWDPPGFYIDEATGAVHAICLQQSGADFTGKFLPLYSDGPGPGSGKYTAPYLFGAAVWSAVFGTSPAGFRSFVGMVTALTIWLMYLWLKKRTNPETALTAAFLGSISPWSFHFSRIAWDPPLAPLFMVLGMVFLDSDNRRLRWLGPLALALASYAYPPCRIQVPALLFFFGGKTLREKGIHLACFLVFLIPMFHASVTDPEYMARGKMLAIWTYYHAPLDLLRVFVGNLWEHFKPGFLLLRGDPNFRHSIQTSGMMSIPEWLILHFGLLAGIGIAIHQYSKHRAWPRVIPALDLLVCAVLGIVPAALTAEGIPHALRSIGAWPFFVMVSALWFHRIPKRALQSALVILILLSTGSTIRYLYHYFHDYPVLASGSFTSGIGKIDSAYPALSSGQRRCQDFNMVPAKVAHPKPGENR